MVFNMINFEILGAICAMPAFMFLAAQGWIWLVVAFVSFPVVYNVLKHRVIHNKRRSRFFATWSVMSFFFLLAVFELEVVPYLEILFSENLALMIFVAIMCVFIFLVKSSSQPASFSPYSNNGLTTKIDLSKRTRCEVCCSVMPLRTYHCDLCGYCIHKRDHHSIWLDICIGSRNQKYFLGALVASLCACLYSSNLTLTTICHPFLLGGFLLMPNDCSDVYGDIHMAICFVSAIYTLMIAVYVLYLLLLQLYLLCYNSTCQEWKQGQMGVYNKGFYEKSGRVLESSYALGTDKLTSFQNS
ncbi:LOW QUALITY PROTEIN: palmitoyltransferase ZDHHC23-like [Uloborus diversus]|uniref:LOW QUALITY PROTEIN: palmitoyltransferase ZDHHC23-like n=1 Tax=Uloborus diversus TaxID=327109 RepID=UPI00240A42BB|nr:LOW QUALITY PROTEIN: palmitoyltransferase ZDHHC23-like [Uloborus diversus]